MKSAITASNGTPSPSISMPVCPVALNVAFMPRFTISRCMASDTYIFPTETSVPTARHLLPFLGRPLAIG